MTDPFQDVESGGADFVEAVVQALETRAAEPAMQAIVATYLDDISYPDGGLHIEVGAGAGPISRQMAQRATNGRVVASDPSPGLVEAGRKLAQDIDNLEFQVADGAALPYQPATVDTVLFHTVLSHVVDPSILLDEAARVLKPGGHLVICDADFEKTSLSNAIGDPLQACAEFFVEHFVTDKYLVAKLRGLVAAAGFDLQVFRVTSRLITDSAGGMAWVGLGGQKMVTDGLIGKPLAEALTAEYQRRIEAGTLYGHQPFVTLVARR